MTMLLNRMKKCLIMNIEKYKNDGWGLSRKCFEEIYELIRGHRLKSIVEFGSGKSTEFFVDMIEDGFDLEIISFDDSLEFATKVSHNKLNLIITDLIETSDENFNKMFDRRIYYSTFFEKKTTPIQTKQKNTFYKINDNQLPNVIDLMVVDGPHGNGRSIAFLHGIGRLKKGSIVVIDDYNHYDFVDRFKTIFPTVELLFESTTGSINQWELGGNYVIFKIVKI